MNKKALITIMIFAGLLLLTGITIAFISLSKLKLEFNNSGYVSAIFSLSGVLLYFAALMYQIKEYKLQVEELKKSVEAQTKSSNALDEQKRILLEQNANSLIFGMIDNFNSFKERNTTHFITNGIVEYYKDIFAIRWQNNLTELKVDRNQLNIEFASGIKDLFASTIVGRDEFIDFKRYVQFVYNILYLIDQNKPNMTRDNFTPFFFSQLSTNETISIYLANLVDFGMPYYNNLQWDYYKTVEIVDVIKKSTMVYTDYENIDCNLLTAEFNKLKQK